MATSTSNTRSSSTSRAASSAQSPRRVILRLPDVSRGKSHVDVVSGKQPADPQEKKIAASAVTVPPTSAAAKPAVTVSTGGKGTKAPVSSTAAAVSTSDAVAGTKASNTTTAGPAQSPAAASQPTSWRMLLWQKFLVIQPTLTLALLGIAAGLLVGRMALGPVRRSNKPRTVPAPAETTKNSPGSSKPAHTPAGAAGAHTPPLPATPAAGEQNAVESIDGDPYDRPLDDHPGPGFPDYNVTPPRVELPDEADQARARVRLNGTILQDTSSAKAPHETPRPSLY